MAEYRLIRPCAKCPFRTDVPSYLRRERALEIAQSLADGCDFPCHETTVDVEGEDGGDDRVADENSQFCAGALITMENCGQANQIMRIAERVGAYDQERLDMKAPVQKSLYAFVEHHHQGEPEEMPETCSVVHMGCLAPAGEMIGGFALPVMPDGEVTECPVCGEPVCENCSGEGGRCDSCADDVDG